MSDLLTPDDFAARKGAIQRVIDARGIDHFHADELYRHHDGDWPFGAKYPPPTRLAKNVGQTLEVADRLREEWGGGVKVLSGYRCPAYNSLIGGAEDSQHQYFRALDLQPVTARTDDYAEWVAHCERVVGKLRDRGQIIGLGTYATFCHIDTGHYSRNRTWSQR